MILLKTGEAYKNNTDKSVYAITEYYNFFGHKQKDKIELTPGMTIFSSDCLKRTCILQ